MQQKIFALDIGTRSVIGIIMERTNDEYKLIDIRVKEHTERTMLDGQIHDIQAVSNVINQLKLEFEQKYGPLTKVCAAAAGRALKTDVVSFEVDISNQSFITNEDVLHFELSAVQQAQKNVAQKQANTKFQSYYCVGYSVLHYYLDGEKINSLIDQHGHTATVEVIATFLPKIVVDSLIKTLENANLQLEALTLEPIAAINVLVPPSMRRLNVALVDIGAGTSDIAITNDNTVTAYGMVPIAGDEITEHISDYLLLDFPEAERIKRELNTNNSVILEDILGFETELPSSEILSHIKPSIERLADSIEKEIFRLNNDASPQAVMLIGGGSQTPLLIAELSKRLHLPPNRVAIRGAHAIQKLDIPDSVSDGPDFITPIGIAISATSSPIHYISVTVNNQIVRMFEAKRLTIADCILASGINSRKLYGKPGLAIFAKINGKQITLPGSKGEPPTILRNEKPAQLDDEIANGDHIIIKPGEAGESPKYEIHEISHIEEPVSVYINGKLTIIQPHISKNNTVADKHAVIEDNDEIIISFPKTLHELCLTQNILNEQVEDFIITVNDKKHVIEPFTYALFLNGKKVPKTAIFKQNDQIISKRELEPTIKHLTEVLDVRKQTEIMVHFNEQAIHLQKKSNLFKLNGQAVTDETIIQNHAILQSEDVDDNEFIFQDIFAYVDIAIPTDNQATFKLLVNDEEATFFTPLKHGDRLHIIWNEKKD